MYQFTDADLFLIQVALDNYKLRLPGLDDLAERLRRYRLVDLPKIPAYTLPEGTYIPE